MMMQFNKEAIRSSMSRTLPKIEPEGDRSLRARYAYVPSSHEKALRLDVPLVEGMRGAGKSFWSDSLVDAAFRKDMQRNWPELGFLDKVMVHQGYGTRQIGDTTYPSKDILEELLLKFEPRTIWKTILALNLSFHPLLTMETWEERAFWVNSHVEEYDRLLTEKDAHNQRANSIDLVLFDALDRLASDWRTIRILVRELLSLVLDYRTCQNIRLKVFLRTDMAQDSTIYQFQDASKLKARSVSLSWRKEDLYALFFACLANDERSGTMFREVSSALIGISWHMVDDSQYLIPQKLRTDEETQKKLFHHIAGPAMASGSSGHKRGLPYTWLVTHLADGKGLISPRSFSTALRHAAQSDVPEEWPFSLHFKGLQQGVQMASADRVIEIGEDYAWVETVMNEVQGVVVPCERTLFLERWKEADLLRTLKEGIVHMLPPSYDQGVDGLLRDLESLGVVTIQQDKRIQMPDVYRIAFRIGRKGGVKPIR